MVKDFTITGFDKDDSLQKEILSDAARSLEVGYRFEGDKFIMLQAYSLNVYQEVVLYFLKRFGIKLEYS